MSNDNNCVNEKGNQLIIVFSKEEEEGEEEVNENEDEEDGENREKKDAVSGPWNKSGQPQSTPTPSGL